jgi:hypothetical protein
MTQTHDRGGRSRRQEGSISLDVLKSIVGGANPNEKKHIDGDFAVALTAGKQDAVPTVAPQVKAEAPVADKTLAAKPAATVLESKVNYGEDKRFDLRLVVEAGSKSPGKPQSDAKVTFVAWGQKGDADGVRIVMSNQETRAKENLTPAQVAAKAQAGDPLFKQLDAQLKEIQGGDKKAPDFSRDVEDGFRKNATGKTAAPAGKLAVSDTHAKAEVKTVPVKDPTTGKTTQKWESSVSTPARDAAKAAAEKAEKAEAQKNLTDKWDADKAKQAADKKAEKQEQARQQTKAAENPLKDMRDADKAHKDAQNSQAKTGEAKRLAEAERDIAKARVPGTEAGVKLAAAKQDPAQMKEAVKAHGDALYREAVSQNQVEKTTAAHSDAKAKAAETKAASEAAQKKFAEAKQQLQGSKEKLSGEAATQAAAKKAAGEGAGKERSNSVGANPVKTGKDKAEETRPRADTMPKQTATKSVEPPKPGRADQVRSVAEKGWGKANEYGSKLLEQADKDAAKAAGKLYSTDRENVLAGGITKVKTTDGDVTKERTTVAQVKTESGTTTYTNGVGRGASAHWNIRAEAGIEDSKTTDHGNGVSTTVTNKAYAGASFENSAKAVVTANSVSAEAATKVTAHAEASHSHTTKIGDVEHKHTISATAHAEANAKAGARLGFDGLSLQAKASVEASVKANLTSETKVGDHTIRNDLEVYAKAKAEAKAEAEVTFNPFAKDGKVKAKIGVGAEASAGVGVEGTTGFHGKNGGADIGAGAYIGKIGAKLDGDFEIKDGKVAASLNVGAALGVGLQLNFKIESNVKQAMQDAARDIEKGNFGEKVLGHLTNNAVGGFFRGLFS